MRERQRMTSFRQRAAMVIALVFSGALTGCVVVGGTSRGGFFLWPGGLGLVLVVLLILFLVRRR